MNRQRPAVYYREFLPYGRQYLGRAEYRAVLRTLKGRFLTQGPAVEEFETALKRQTGAAYAVAVSNGTMALQLAVQAVKMRYGIHDEALGLTSPNTFVATGNAMLYNNIRPVFCDISPISYNMSLTEAEGLLERYNNNSTRTGRIELLLPVHFAGQLLDMAQLYYLAQRYSKDSRRLPIIEDATHALGSHGAGSCEYSDACCFSFHPVKTITTAEGGAITCCDPALHQLLIQLRSHGITRLARLWQNLAENCEESSQDSHPPPPTLGSHPSQGSQGSHPSHPRPASQGVPHPTFGLPPRLGSPPSQGPRGPHPTLGSHPSHSTLGSHPSQGTQPLQGTHPSHPTLGSQGPLWYYEMQYLGHNARLSDVHAALGSAQLQRLESFVRKRRRLVKCYNQALSSLSWLRTPTLDSTCCPHLYVLQIDFARLGHSRNIVMEVLRKQGIGTQVHYIPVPMQPYYRSLGYTVEGLKQTIEYYCAALSLPLYPGLSIRQQRRIILAVYALGKT